jgi:hypothetical protein
MTLTLKEIEQLRDAKLDELRAIERKLNSSSVQLHWEDQTIPKSQREDFFEQRREIIVLRSKLENEVLARIAKRLEMLEPDLSDGINNLNAQIDRINENIAFINTLSRITGILARILVII